MTKEKLIQKIKKAFGQREFPRDNNICSESNYPCLEREQITNDFKGQKWQDLTVDFLVPSQRGFISFLSDEAFCYYLPGIMIVTILDWEKADCLTESIIYHLTPSFYKEIKIFDELEKQLNLFTPAEKIVIKEYLEFMKNEHQDDDYYVQEINKALKEYWSYVF